MNSPRSSSPALLAPGASSSSVAYAPGRDERLPAVDERLVAPESTTHATKKARKLAMRGVRRLFSVRVEDRAVHEWQHDTGTWTSLSPDAQIVDRCFALPIPVRALADEMLADETVVRVVVATRHPLVLAEIEQGEARGEVKGRRDALRAPAAGGGAS